MSARVGTDGSGRVVDGNTEVVVGVDGVERSADATRLADPAHAVTESLP